jgi:acetyl esterase/lipase
VIVGGESAGAHLVALTLPALRERGELGAVARWQESGNDAELALYPGAPHEFLNLRDQICAERQARERMIAFVERLLNRT